MALNTTQKKRRLIKGRTKSPKNDAKKRQKNGAYERTGGVEQVGTGGDE